MTTKKISDSHVTASHTHATSSHPRSAMHTKKSSTHSSDASSDSESISASVEQAAAPAVVPAPIPVAIAPAAPLPAIYLTPPPANALIPGVPSYFVPDSGTNYRGVVPRKAELIALPLAVADLRKFANYAQVIGSTAPPYAEVLDTFDVTNQWSSMRTSSSAWDVFCRDQEGMCWGVMRPTMESLKSAFDLAVTRDPSLTAKLPGLAALLGVKQAIARKAVSTKRANKKALAEGKPATHGEVGKTRKKQSDKAILAAAADAPESAPVTHAVAPVAPTAPVVNVVSSPAPVAVVSTPVASPAPVMVPASVAPVAPVASPAPAAPVNGVAPATNGAAN